MLCKDVVIRVEEYPTEEVLDDIQVDFLIQATQADKRTSQLTAPRLTFTNGQIASIYVVTQQAFVSGLTPITGDNAVGFQPTVSTVAEYPLILMTSEMWMLLEL